MSITTEFFGTSAKGLPVERINLQNSKGMSCSLITHGATVQSLLVPDRQGQLTDMILGYDSLDRYESTANPFHGATLGRHAGRVGGAAFELNGKLVQLTANEGRNNLHSCPEGLNQVVWGYEIITTDPEPAVRLTYHSPDGESGFPGNLACHVTYRLTSDNALWIKYDAAADQDTVINLTNHSYFNLAGQGSGSVLDHELILESDEFTPVDAELLPDGRILKVSGTPFDFRQAKAIGRDIGADNEQLRLCAGYDHNFVVLGTPGALRLCAMVREPKSGRTLSVETTSPGVQLYTGNFLDETGKAGRAYARHGGFCLETQYFPNSFQHKHFPSPIFKAGEPFRHTTVYRFSI